MVATLDFAENYCCGHQDQPQSAHCSYQQVTLYPVTMAYKCPCCGEQVSDTAVFFSDNLDHSSHSVNCVTEIMLDHWRTTLGPSLKKVIIFSDGCCSQYKSKIPFFYLTTNSWPCNWVLLFWLLDLEKAYVMLLGTPSKLQQGEVWKWGRQWSAVQLKWWSSAKEL